MTFKEDISKPFNYISLSLAIIGIAFGVYSYLESKRTRSISYHIDQPSLIYDSENASSAIKVVAKDSTPIDDDVYLLNGRIWNSGNLPVNAEDVRQSLSINLLLATKILDFKITGSTDSSVAKFNLTKRDNRKLDLSWKYFDPGYGFNFQIIYTGEDNPKFNLAGKVLDVQGFSKVEQIDKADSVLKSIRSLVVLIFLGIIVQFLPTLIKLMKNLIKK
jgi:hypothetical protein